jgi:hypothetical protein
VKEFKNDENLPIINILKKPNKGRGKGMTWKDTSLGKLRILQRGIHKGKEKKSST